MTDESDDGGISRREAIGGIGAATVAAVAGAAGYFVMDGNDITYASDDGDGNGSEDDEEMAQFSAE
jgi:hypothetical protein